MPDSGRILYRREPDCALAPRKYEPRVSRLGGKSGGLGRGAQGFWSKVKMGHHDKGCWEWIGYLDADGYGKFTTSKITGKPRSFRAHRLAFELEFGPITDGLFLLHTCDNRRCVRPDHLRQGTQAENIADMIAKGRKAPAPDNRGELCPTAKLDTDAVLFIRAQRKAPHVCELLAEIYGVSLHTIHKIRGRRTWKHLGNGDVRNAMSVAQLRELLRQRGERLTDAEEQATRRTG